MKDLRCMLGRHKYQERHTPDTHPPSKEGLYLSALAAASRQMPLPSEFQAIPMVPAELRWAAARAEAGLRRGYVADTIALGGSLNNRRG